MLARRLGAAAFVGMALEGYDDPMALKVDLGTF